MRSLPCDVTSHSHERPQNAPLSTCPNARKTAPLSACPNAPEGAPADHRLHTGLRTRPRSSPHALSRACPRRAKGKALRRERLLRDCVAGRSFLFGDVLRYDLRLDELGVCGGRDHFRLDGRFLGGRRLDGRRALLHGSGARTECRDLVN